jgi:dihydroflavonol-4-reductase
MPRHVLLTGVSGFIAKRIACDLLDAGYTVRGSLRSAARADEVRDALRAHLADPDALDRLSFVELDLTSDAGWAAAMGGVDAVLHTASPFPMVQPKDDDDLIRPAVDGTLRALRAAQAAGVRRVVLTSSMVAIMHSTDRTGPERDEDDWSDPDAPTTTAYDRSKTLAERAAWDFATEHPEMQLTTINPGLITGTPLDAHYGTSLALIERVFLSKDPMVPNLGLPIVDLADVSLMHIRAMERPETAGQRFIGCDSFWMLPEIARLFARNWPDRKYSTRVAPRFVLRALALFDPAIRSALPSLDIRLAPDNGRARAALGIDFTPAEDSLLASARFIAEARA